MKKNIIYISLAIGLIGFNSCSDLELEDTDSVSQEATGEFEGVSDVESSLVNAYNAIQGHLQTQESLYALQEVTSDELLIPTRGTDWGDNGVWRTLHQHTWDATHRFILNTWNNFNSSIYTATTIIAPESEANSQQVAEAKFLRAFSMFWIIDLYGQVPFREVNEGPDIDPRILSRSEAFDFAVQDLEEALPDLPATGRPGAETDAASKASANLLLAKLYLNKHIYLGTGEASPEDMDQVIAHVDAIQEDGFELQEGFFEIFDPEVGASDTEIIFRINYGADTRMWSSLHYNQNTPQNSGGGWNGFTTLSEFYNLFEGDPNSNQPGSGQEERRGFVPTSGNPAGPGDLDEENDGAGDGIEDGSNIGYGFLVGQQYNIDGSEMTDRSGNPLIYTKELPGLVGNPENTGIRVLKYHPSDGAFPSNLIVFRYSDAHLMKAEAIFRGGSSSETALGLVNELRVLREATPLASLEEEALLDERGRELYIEFWRRHDQIRFGTYTDTWAFKESTDAYRVLFPIPATALTSNPNLVQNEGY